MSTFELMHSESSGRGPGVPSGEGLGQVMLLKNAHWFTQIRWLVIATFVFVGLAGRLAPGAFRALGILPPGAWLLQLAAAAAVFNAAFAVLAHRLKDDSPLPVLRGHLWLQILADLLAVTVLVHRVGSVDTFIAFTYLFHIVLACIFFSRRESLMVTVVAAGMYLACVVLEISAFGHGARIFLDVSPVNRASPRTAVLMASSAVIVWFVVWYFAATLSQAVRHRDAELLSANARLVQADAEKNRMVLRTVHDLKAPFTGIESNIQILQLKHWDDTSEPVRAILGRIAARAQSLRDRIRDILTLGDLRSGRARPEAPARVDLRALIESVVEPLAEKALSLRLRLDIDAVLPVEVVTQKGRLAVLISNIIDNAVSYSRAGGTVVVSTVRAARAVRIRVADSGIGIADADLPHVFDEYYRSREAAAFNKTSTGLGLAIVKEVAQQLGVSVLVTSEHGAGTTFEVRIPAGETKQQKGK